MIHQHSIQAFHEERPKLSKREQLIYDFLLDKSIDFTDREIMQILNFTEPNQVRPRVTELIKKGLVREWGKMPCPVTGKTVRTVGIVFEPVQLELVE